MSKKRLERAIKDMNGVREMLSNSDEEESLRLIIEQAKTLEKCTERNKELEEENINKDFQIELVEMEREAYYSQNKRYREFIEQALEECVKDRPITAEKILAKALEREEE